MELKSVTPLLLERRHDWDGICIEATPYTFARLRKNRSVDCVNSCLDSGEILISFKTDGMMGGVIAKDTRNQGVAADSQVVEMKTVSLEQILISRGAPKVIDYLSIDVEGSEDRVLMDFDFRSYTFLSITIELPSSALRSKLKSHDYILVRDIPGLDAFYVHESHRDEYLMNVYTYHSKKFLHLRWS